MAYEAKIILDSVGPNGARLTTFELSYPRFVHSEFLTHRVFSRNSASSRAIPTERLLSRIEHDPVCPVFWGANVAGMQSREELSDERDASGLSLRIAAKNLWLEAVMSGVRYARQLGEIGLHKQIANRAAELGMFITVVVTASEWGNFFALRDHPDAQPELADVAAKAHALYREHKPDLLHSGAWHLPYVTGFDFDELWKANTSEMDICLISVGRCAAVSYLNQDKRDPQADLVRAAKNLKAGHMSPFEHVAQALTQVAWELECREAAVLWREKRIPIGNIWGWRQLRKTLPNEHDFGRILARGT